MIGLLIITHESIGEAYRKLAQHFFPDGIPGSIHMIGVRPDEDHEDVIRRANEQIQNFTGGNGILILSDIFGATPCNAARKLVHPDQTAILTGLNAPMLIKAIQHAPNADNLQTFTESVKNAAVQGIFAITDSNGLPCSP